MKKTIIFLFLIIFSFQVNAQCNISGPSTVNLGTSATFSIPNLGQCTQCYDWDVLSSNINITSSDMNNNVTILATSIGQAHLRVTYFDENGCQTCDINFEVVPTPPVCCQPQLDSYFICRGWAGGHGAVYIDFTANNCDRNSVSSIDWIVNGAVFSTGPLTGQSSGTTYGPGSPGNIESGCNRINVTATVHYNNGCPDVTLTEDVNIDSGPNDNDPYTGFGKILIYPNPTTSNLNIDFSMLKDVKKLEVKLYELNTGKEIYSKKILKEEFNKNISINHLDNYDLLKVIILNDGKVIKKSIVLIDK